MLSIKGMTREVLKPGTWKLFRHIKDDFEKAYKQMTKTALTSEIALDINALFNALENIEGQSFSDIKNAILVDKETENAALLLKKPEDIKHVKDMFDEEQCNTLIVINFNEKNDKTHPKYICYKNGQFSRYIY